MRNGQFIRSPTIATGNRPRTPAMAATPTRPIRRAFASDPLTPTNQAIVAQVSDSTSRARANGKGASGKQNNDATNELPPSARRPCMKARCGLNWSFVICLPKYQWTDPPISAQHERHGCGRSVYQRYFLVQLRGLSGLRGLRGPSGSPHGPCGPSLAALTASGSHLRQGLCDQLLRNGRPRQAASARPDSSLLSVMEIRAATSSS